MRKLSKKQKILIFVTIIILTIIYYFYSKNKEYVKIEENNSDLNIENTEITEIDGKNNIEKNKISEANNIEDSKISKIKIYITGEVQRPGIYEIEEESRIDDAINAAGGLTEKANIKDINLAYKVEDGMKIYIPSNDEKVNEKTDKTLEYVESGKAKTPVAATSDKEIQQSSVSAKININTATQSELERLPGVGEAIAKRILEYRKSKGRFEKIEDIKNVKGIGDSKFNKLKDKIVVKWL